MNIIINTIKENISAQKITFVFPSQVSAELWARKTCTLGIARSVASDRFLAWDRFKEKVIDQEESGRKPASAVVRKLFAEALLKKNASVAGASANGESQNGFPLKALVPPEYAESGSIFSPFIARFLPQLAYWEKMTNNSCAMVRDEEDDDYQTIKNEYAAFLERNKFYEPAWEEFTISENDLKYIIFYPELIEDFTEYKALLKPPRFTIINVKISPSEMNLFFYRSAREEIRSAVTEIRKIHEEEGIPYTHMAVSVPDLQEIEPYLLQEFALRSVPVTRRAGRKLGETGAGKLFSLIIECAGSRFSFNSLKALILNDRIPWMQRDKNKALISFGIRYNCVSSYVQEGGDEDIWEEAFNQAPNDGGRELRPYYRELKRTVNSLAKSESFAALRKNYFAFRRSLLDMEKISSEDDAVLSRCIEELNTLTDLEKMFDDPALIPKSPAGFLISYLNEKDYVRAGLLPGVNIYKWRVAAASPFALHFVLNASQSAASVLYQPMKFLRQDKRKSLGLEDSDASGAFFALCDTGADGNFKTTVRISASSQTYSGWAIPHSFFTGGKITEASSIQDNTENEPYRTERGFWRDNGKDGKNCALGEIFPLQKISFEEWKNILVQKEKNFSFFHSPFSTDLPIGELLKKTALDKEGFLTVSPTRDLNVYYKCPVSWLFARVFKTEEFSLEAALLDDTSLGLLYHKILENVFAKIKNEDGTFEAKRINVYKSNVNEITREAIKEHPAFKGPLAIPLVTPQAAGMAKKISNLLELEAKNFNGYIIENLEIPVSYKKDGLHIKGIIDRVSISPEGAPVIFDYKTGKLPKQTDDDNDDEPAITEFQMPLYIKLYEQTSCKNNMNVTGAYFYSINEKRIMPVMGDRLNSKTTVPDREEYNSYLEAAEKQIEEFAHNVKALNFIPPAVKLRDCFDCVYKTVCRSAYFLNRGMQHA